MRKTSIQNPIFSPRLLQAVLTLGFMGNTQTSFPEYTHVVQTTSSEIVGEVNQAYDTLRLRQVGPTQQESLSSVALLKHLQNHMPAEHARRVLRALAGCVPSARLLAQDDGRKDFLIPRQVYVVAAVTLKQGLLSQCLPFYTALLGVPLNDSMKCDLVTKGFAPLLDELLARYPSKSAASSQIMLEMLHNTSASFSQVPLRRLIVHVEADLCTAHRVDLANWIPTQ